jgi:hypothetical protein
MLGSAQHDLTSVMDRGSWGSALERSFAMKKKGKKEDAKGPKKGK